MPVKAPKGTQPNVPITELPDEWIEYTIQSASHPGVRKSHEAERTRRGTSWTNPVLQTQGYASPGAAALAAGSAVPGMTGAGYTDQYKQSSSYKASQREVERSEEARLKGQQDKQRKADLKAYQGLGDSRGTYARYLSGEQSPANYDQLYKDLAEQMRQRLITMWLSNIKN